MKDQLNIHEKINAKIGIFKEDTSKLLPINYCISNYRELIEESKEYGKEENGLIPIYFNENHPFRRTMAFVFGIDLKSDSLIAHNCYRYKYRNIAKKTLKEIYKSESKHLFRRCLDYPEFFNLKKEKDLLTIKKTVKMKNPIIELSELVQRQYGRNIETRVTGKTGADHMPTVSVEIELPDGRIFQANGTNKRIAKQKAAEKALSEFANVN